MCGPPRAGVVLALVLASSSLLVARARSEQCPGQASVQPPKIVRDYNVTKAQGQFYEIFYRDVVEDACRCFSKTRRLANVGGRMSLHDTDRLFCGVSSYMRWYSTTEDNFLLPGQNAQFNLTMNSPLIRRVNFPNWVIGYGEAAGGDGEYVWVVEYQCIETLGVQTYLGFNIYHRSWDPPQAHIDQIREVVAQAGYADLWGRSIKPMGGAMCNYSSADGAHRSSDA